MSAREIVEIDARAELLAALITRDVARENLTSAQVAADRATELLGRAELRVYNFSTLNEQIARDTASRVAAWSRDGGEQPDLAPDARFTEQLRRRREAEEHCAAAQTAARTLAEALADARRKFAETKFAVGAAATAVMIEEAKPLAERLTSARREAWKLESLLTTLMSQ